LNKDGAIDFHELQLMLENSLTDRQIAFTEEDIRHICRNTLRLLDPERQGFIVYARYEELVQQNPSTLNPFVVNIDDIFARFDV
jgi:hypothetical protein